MRIIHATTSAEITTLGMEKMVVNLAEAQKARGSDVMIAIDRQGVFTETCGDRGIPVTIHDGLGDREGASVVVTAEEHDIQKFIECLDSFKPDIIHCHSTRAGLVAISAGNRVNIPCTATGDGPANILEGWRRGLRFAAICLTMTNFARLKNEACEMSMDHLYYIPNGTRTVPQTRERESAASDSVNLILAGKLILRKGIDIALLAMVELRRRMGQDCPVLNIYGDGPRKEFLTEMASVLELDDLVSFHGFQLEVLERCPSTDVLIMPSRNEASPLVVLEAMSRGMPIVATDVGDVTEMLPDERYGRVIPPDSVVALAEAIQSLLADIAEGKFNPNLLIERHRSLYSFETWAERIEEVYKQVLLSSSVITRQSR
jgi:glycosyltransferase involved in cell wall biosynthesis